MWALVLRPSGVRSHRGVRLHLIPNDASGLRNSRRLSTETEDKSQLPLDEIAASPQQETPPDVKAPSPLHPFGKKGAAMDAKVERIEKFAQEDDWDVTPKLAKKKAPPLLKFGNGAAPRPPPPKFPIRAAPSRPLFPLLAKKEQQVEKAKTAPPAHIPTHEPNPSTQSQPESKSQELKTDSKSQPIYSVALCFLPRFTTLSDLSRIALRSGARPEQVLGLELSVLSKTGARAWVHSPHTWDDGNSQNYVVGARIDFSDPALVEDFRANPLFLELQNAAQSLHPKISVFPPAADAAAWPRKRLDHLVSAIRTGIDERIRAVLNGNKIEAEVPAALKRLLRAQSGDEESHDETQEEISQVEHHSEKQQQVLERENALTLMWGRLEDPDASEQLPDQIVPYHPETDIDGSEHPRTEELVDELLPESTQSTIASPPEPSNIIHVSVARIRPRNHPRYTQEVVDHLVKYGSGRWLGLRLPGSGLSVVSPLTRPNTGAYMPSTLGEVELDEHTDPAVRLYALSLRKSLARERELEEVFWDTRIEAMERTVRDAKLVAEAQLRTDFGAFGAIEGVWLRGKPVRRLSGDSAEAEQTVYELHALIAFADTQDAIRARTLVPVQNPAYAESQIRFVKNPWPEALGGEPPALEVDGSETEAMSPIREGWARRMQREQDEEQRLRKRELERERERGVAEGTWGKERLHEIRARLNRNPGSPQDENGTALGQLQNGTLETIGLVTTVLTKHERRERAKRVAKTVMMRVQAKAWKEANRAREQVSSEGSSAEELGTAESSTETEAESNSGSSGDDKKTPSVHMPYVAHF